jgi:hypothetical protein
MADDQGLFGPTPFQIQQAQQAQLQNAASEYARLDPLQRAAQGMFTAGGQIMGASAPALGMINPAQAQSQQTQDAVKDLDISTPEGMMKAAQRLQSVNPSLATALAAKAREVQATSAKTAYETSQAAQKESQSKLDASRAALADARAAALDRDSNFKNLPPTVQAIMLKSQLPSDSPALPEITKWIESQSEGKGESSPTTVKEYKYAVTNDGYKGTYQQWLKEKAQATHITVNAGAPIGQDAADMAIDMYRKGDPSMLTGWGRDPKNKAMIINRMAERVKAGEFTPTDLVNAKVALAGATSGSRALGTQEALMGTGGEELTATLPLVQHYAEATNPTDYPVLNAAGLYIAKNTGDPNQAGLAASLNSLVNVYARAISPKAPTVADKNHARDIINQAMSAGQLNTVADVMRYEAQAARASPERVRARLGAQTGGSAAPVMPTIPGTPAAPKTVKWSDLK